MAPEGTSVRGSLPERSRADRLSAGCAKEPPKVPDHDERVGDAVLELESGGQKRSYRLGMPSAGGPTEPAGVILNLHGSGSNAAQQTVYSQMAKRGIERGYVVVTPDANNGNWQLGPGADDDFLMALLDKVVGENCVDLDRVHAVGISLGSWKATATACGHPDRVASIVLVAEEVAPPNCAKPVVAFHGTADRVVPYGTGADEGVEVTGSNKVLPGVEVNMPAWAENAGCSPNKDIERIEPDVARWVFRDCPQGLEVQLYSIEGGGHTWPGSPVELPALGKTTRTVDATGIALDWFDAHPMKR